MQQWFGAFDRGFLLLVRLFPLTFWREEYGRQDIEEVNSMLSVPMLVSRYRQTSKKAVRPFFFLVHWFWWGFFVWGHFGSSLFVYLRGSGDGLLSFTLSIWFFSSVTSNIFLVNSQNWVAANSILFHYTVAFLDLILLALMSITFQILPYPSL